MDTCWSWGFLSYFCFSLFIFSSLFSFSTQTQISFLSMCHLVCCQQILLFLVSSNSLWHRSSRMICVLNSWNDLQLYFRPLSESSWLISHQVRQHLDPLVPFLSSNGCHLSQSPPPEVLRAAGSQESLSLIRDLKSGVSICTRHCVSKFRLALRKQPNPQSSCYNTHFYIKLYL